MATRKAELFDSRLSELADKFRLLGHPARLAILQELAGNDRCQCGEIVTQLPLAQATVSQHLKQLRDGGLIAGEVSGPAICYCLNQKSLKQFISASQAFLAGLDSSMPCHLPTVQKESNMSSIPVTSQNADEVKDAVRERYRESAVSGGCCSTDQGCGCGCGDRSSDVIVDSSAYAGEKGYVAEADLGLGCGIPSRFANIKAGETVLDLGSGAGNDVFIAATHVGPSGMVIGVDMTPEMVSKARRIARERAITNVDFRLGEIEALPVADAVVDLAISNCVINLVPDKSRVFAELARVIKPGGRFVISDIVTTGELPESVLRSMAQYVGCVAGASLQSDYEKMMLAAGFSRIEIAERRVVDRGSWDPEGKAAAGVDVLSVTFVAYR